MLDLKGRTPLELSKTGDPLVNLIYSLALSKASGRPRGKKVSNTILAEALNVSDLRKTAGKRMSKSDLGGHAEGLIFKAWIDSGLRIGEAVDIVSKNISPTSRGKDLKAESIKGFALLLKHINDLWEK